MKKGQKLPGDMYLAFAAGTGNEQLAHVAVKHVDAHVLPGGVTAHAQSLPHRRFRLVGTQMFPTGGQQRYILSADDLILRKNHLSLYLNYTPKASPKPCKKYGKTP